MSASKILARKRSRRASDEPEPEDAASAKFALQPVPHTRRAKVVALISHGATAKYMTLMNNWCSLLPHMRKDCKLEQKDRVDTIPEIAELAGCNMALFFEVRKHSDLYLWAGKVPTGPSVKFHVQALHTMDELNLTGNCLKGSRGIVTFDSSFDDPDRPHLLIIRELLGDIFGVPEGHPKSKPFVDHVHSFAIDSRGKIHYRHYQVAPNPTADLSKAKSASDQMLVEIGPRCTLMPMRLFVGAFGGPTLYANPNFVSPNHVRAELRRRTGDKYANKVRARDARRKRQAAPERQIPADELDDVFKD